MITSMFPFKSLTHLSHLFSGTIARGVIACKTPFGIPDFAIYLLFVTFLIRPQVNNINMCLSV